MSKCHKRFCKVQHIFSTYTGGRGLTVSSLASFIYANTLLCVMSDSTPRWQIFQNFKAVFGYYTASEVVLRRVPERERRIEEHQIACHEVKGKVCWLPLTSAPSHTLKDMSPLQRSGGVVLTKIPWNTVNNADSIPTASIGDAVRMEDKMPHLISIFVSTDSGGCLEDGTLLLISNKFAMNKETRIEIGWD